MPRRRQLSDRNHIAIVPFAAAFALCWAAVSVAQQPTPSAAKADSKADDSAWTLVWSDEFNDDGPPDEKNWTFERGFVRNEELQWYQPENAVCKDGMLVIEARRERVKNPNYRTDSRNWKQRREHAEYTSACLKTSRLHEWKYGRFEMRGRIDTRDGLWPAFWTLGSARGWPGCGEIDIMEYFRGNLLANACWSAGRGFRPVWDDVRKPIGDFGDPKWSSKFHVWRMDWDEDSIELYVDDQLLNTVDVTKSINNDAARTNPLREPHYILLNLAVGGTNGGDPSKTELPARFEIDYVRVSQKR
jgi:beta-glucanase (GH16 family)